MKAKNKACLDLYFLSFIEILTCLSVFYSFNLFNFPIFTLIKHPSK